jgi:hypothetical protein
MWSVLKNIVVSPLHFMVERYASAAGLQRGGAARMARRSA